MSFNSDMTNLANAIRTKAGVTGGLTVSAMTTAVNGIVINTGSDIDLSGVNVTADKLLAGIVAVDASGEKVTGNIATVTPSVSANVFTVSKGYVAQDAELTVPEAAALSVSGNVVTVPVGYIKTERTATIPEAAVTETDSSVTIGIGYVSEELTYNLGSGGSDIDFTGVNVTANNLLEGIVAIGHDGGKVTGRMNYSTPRRDGSSVIVPQGYVDQQYTFEQMQVGYDTSAVTASFDNMLQGTIAVGPSGERIEGGIPTLTTDSISVSNGVVFVTGPGYISDDGVAGLRYELPESTVTTTDTTLTATVGYLKEPISFTASGGGGGSGAFDLAKVTEYTPYAPEITAPTAIEVSGMGIFGEEDPDYAEDYTAANGKYVVTAETSGKEGRERIYKHETEDCWFKSYKDEYDEYGGDGWTFVTDINDDYGFLYNIPYELESGTSEYWHNEDWGEDFTLTLNVTTTTTPETPMVLKGVKATGYADGEWSFADSEQNFTGFENTPKPSFIYAVSGNKLIGDAVAVDMDVPAGTVFLFDKSLTDVIGGIPVTNYGLTASSTGIVCADGKYAEIPAGTLPADVMCDDKPWTFEIKFRCLDTASSWSDRCLFGRGDPPSRFDVLVNKNSIGIGGLQVPIDTSLNDTEWHIYKITHTSANVFTTYLDDAFSKSTSSSGYNMRDYAMWIGSDGGSRFAAPFEIEYVRIGNTVEA